jgi:two-component system cell cycle sensor histidine kinase/response regulator CckA
MQRDVITTLCEALEVPMLREDGQGRVQRLSGQASLKPTDLAASLVDLTEGQCDHALARQLVEAARGGRGSDFTTDDGHRVLVQPDPEGGVWAVVIPPPDAGRDSLRKRAAAADLAAGVSHELANALGAIAGWAQLARRGQRVDEALELIESSASHAWTAAKQMLHGVGHGGEAESGAAATNVDLSSLVDEVAKLLLPKAARSRVRIRTSLAPQLCVRALRGELWTIVWNLASNAVEAMPNGGTLALELSADGEQVRLRVEDDGAGMNEDVRARIFAPYFTTKTTGTGLGLPMVKRTVEGLGGQLQLDSQPGRGTRFSVVLPRVRTEATRRRRVSSGRRSSGVFLSENLEGRVLVVDDDRPLREMVATAVGMRGAVVISAASGLEALEQEPPFELAIIDLLLPDMSGDELLARLRKRGIVKGAIIASGMALPEQFALGGEPDAVLRKPYELEDLFERISEVLAATADRSAAS